MNYFIRILLQLLLVGMISCGKREANSDLPVATGEQHRPTIHFSPKAGWMNDPNGLFYINGVYHLFYQHYPDSTVWGPMHWGHATSTDLVTWREDEIALYPDSLGYIFSGSAVVDTQNTSGFGTAGNPPVVAIFTYHDPEGERSGRDDFQSQGLAYSLDKGITWTKYDKNPVLKSPGIRDFRDPKVAWNEKSGQWVLTLAVSDHIEFYGSKDLKAWTKLSDFGKSDGDHGGVWECPDLFELTDEKGVSHYVLLVSINPGAPNGGSGTQYFIGDFDGEKFISDTPGKNSGWIDYGTDNYAGVTWSNVPAEDGRRIFMGWMSNWLYAQVVPTKAWRSAMTIPRTLALSTYEKGHIIKSQPIAELEGLIVDTWKIVSTTSDTVRVPVDSLQVPLMLKGSVAVSDFRLELANMLGQKLVVGFDPARKEFSIDRSVNMPSDFHPEFKNRMVAPRRSVAEIITFTAIVDVASIEIFFDDGSTVMTAITFPDEVFGTIRLYGGSGTINTGEILVYQLKADGVGMAAIE